MSGSDSEVAAIDPIDRIRAAMWTLRHIVPAWWWSTPPNQATRDVLEGITALERVISEATTDDGAPA